MGQAIEKVAKVHFTSGRDQLHGHLPAAAPHHINGNRTRLFALANLPHRPDGDPRDDLDLAGLGIVTPLEGVNGVTYPDLPWEPKLAFAAVAEHHAR